MEMLSQVKLLKEARDTIVVDLCLASVTLYSDHPRSNAAYGLIKDKNTQKEAWVGPYYK